MSAQYKYTLDGQSIQEPGNWRNVTEVIRFNRELRGLIKVIDTTMTFTGKAFTMLWNKAQTNWDSSSAVVIKESPNGNGNFRTIYNGVFLTSDVTFNHSEQTASVKVRDNSYEAVISGGKSVPVNIEATKSKNGTTITPARRSTLIMVNPCTANPHAFDDPIVWRVEDAFRQVLSFLSDGAIDFYSPLLEDGGEYDGFCITTGAFLNPVTPAADERAPTVSLLQLLTEVGRKRNTVFYIDTSGTRPVFTLDYVTNIRSTNKSVSLRHVRPITTSFDVERIYSTVKFGSPDFVERGADPCNTTAYFEEVDFYTIKEEEYTVIGSNNIDNTLDLTTEWITSGNLIQNSFFNSNPDNDGDIFLIDARNDPAYATNFEVIAEQSDILGDGGAILNYRLFNSEVAQQFLGGVPRDIVLRLAPISDLFKAYKSQSEYFSTTNFISPFQFDDDYNLGNDAGNNYGNGTTQGSPVSAVNSRWTAPSTGVANLRASIEANIGLITGTAIPQGHVLGIKFLRYNSSNVLLQTYTKTYIQGVNGVDFNVFNSTIFEIEKSVFVNSGDYIVVWLGTISTAPASITYFINEANNLTFFELTSDSFSGGTMKVYDSADYPVYTIEGNCIMDNEKWNSVDLYRFDQIEVSDDWNNKFSGWIDEVKYNRFSSEFQYKLIATESQIV